MIKVFDALRQGSALAQSTRWKWAGVAFVALSLANTAARLAGYESGFTDTEILELVALLGALYTQLATTEKIGILPKRGE